MSWALFGRIVAAIFAFLTIWLGGCGLANLCFPHGDNGVLLVGALSLFLAIQVSFSIIRGHFKESR